MSWEAKTDYAGLEIANKLICKSSNENRSGQYLEKTGEHGDIVATKPFGTKNATPSNEYTVIDDISFTSGQIKLGAVTSVGQGQNSSKYMLKSVKISTGGAQEPTFSAESVQVEDSATTDNYFAVPAFTLSADDISQILFSAFTLSTAGCEHTKVDAEISCDVGLHNVNGDPKASDPANAHIQVTATIIQTDTTAPAPAAADGWDVSSPLTCEDPDADIPTWTVTYSKPISKTMGSASGGGSGGSQT